jgi:glutamate N-acetyltransferase / amino-acid N-acetyltransferase
MSFHETPVFPRGFRCASRNVGLKPSAKDLTLFSSEVEAAAAAVFTRNHFPGAPIVLGRETMRGGALRAIIANSKVSNVATGTIGVEHARRMAAAAATELGTTPDRVLVSSTGVIGVPLADQDDRAGIPGIAGRVAGRSARGCRRHHDHRHTPRRCPARWATPRSPGWPRARA